MSSATTAVSGALSATEPTVLRAFEVDFAPAYFRVRHMRSITAAHLRLWDLATLIEPATLVVSELVTNAIQHCEGAPVNLRVKRYADELRVEVADGTPKLPKTPCGRARRRKRPRSVDRRRHRARVGRQLRRRDDVVLPRDPSGSARKQCSPLARTERRSRTRSSRRRTTNEGPRDGHNRPGHGTPTQRS